MDHHEYELEQGQSHVEAEQRMAYTRLVRQLQWRTMALAGALMLALGMAIIGWVRYRQVLQAEVAVEATRVKAEHEANLAVTKVWQTLGLEIFKTKPLLGVRLLLESWTLMRSNDQELADLLTKPFREFVGSGRLVSVSQGDAQIISFGENSSIFVLNRTDLPSELRSIINGAIVETLPGPIAFYEENYPTHPRYNNDSSSFIIGYHNGAPGEVRRIVDGSLLTTLPSRISRIQSDPNEGGYFVVSYSDANNYPSELRRSEDGALLSILPGLISTVTFSSDKPATRLVAAYEDAYAELGHNTNPGELRRTSDGTLVTTLSGSRFTVAFSPDGTYFVVNYNDSIPTELRRTSDGALIFTYSDASLTFSPDKAVSHFIVNYFNDKPAELRRTYDGSLVSKLSGPVANTYFSPDEDSAYVVIDYGSGRPAELYRAADGALITTLAASISLLIFVKDGGVSYFVVSYNDSFPSELRRTADGSVLVTFPNRVSNVRSGPGYTIIDYDNTLAELYHTVDGQLVALSGPISFVTYNQAGTYFVVNYNDDTLGELYRTADGSRIAVLSGSKFEVRFSPDEVGAYFTVGYRNRQPEVRRTIDGALLATIPGPVLKINFSPEAIFFIVTYFDGQNDLWQTQYSKYGLERAVIVESAGEIGGQAEPNQDSSRRLIRLGPDLARYHFSQSYDRFFVWYNDGRIDLVDLAWLRAIGGQADTMPMEELVSIACEGPFADDLFDEAELKPYLGDREPQACKK